MGALKNPRSGGVPVMLGFDGHHPDCFTFPDESGNSESVECPDDVLRVLDDCRGARLYRKGASCTCVPVSGDPPSEVACPGGIE